VSPPAPPAPVATLLDATDDDTLAPPAATVEPLVAEVPLVAGPLPVLALLLVPLAPFVPALPPVVPGGSSEHASHPTDKTTKAYFRT